MGTGESGRRAHGEPACDACLRRTAPAHAALALHRPGSRPLRAARRAARARRRGARRRARPVRAGPRSSGRWSASGPGGCGRRSPRPASSPAAFTTPATPSVCGTSPGPRQSCSRSAPAASWSTARPSAVVGARRASEYGVEVARTLGRGLSAAGVTVVSGMAMGVDAAAHEGALAVGGATVAVLGLRRRRRVPGEPAAPARSADARGDGRLRAPARLHRAALVLSGPQPHHRRAGRGRRRGRGRRALGVAHHRSAGPRARARGRRRSRARHLAGVRRAQRAALRRRPPGPRRAGRPRPPVRRGRAAPLRRHANPEPSNPICAPSTGPSPAESDTLHALTRRRPRPDRGDGGAGRARAARVRRREEPAVCTWCTP